MSQERDSQERDSIIWNIISSGMLLRTLSEEAATKSSESVIIVAANMFSRDPKDKVVIQVPTAIETSQQARLDEHINAIEEWIRRWHIAKDTVGKLNIKDHPGLVIVVNYGNDNYAYIILAKEDKCHETVNYGQAYDNEEQKEKIMSLTSWVDDAMHSIILAEAESRLEDGRETKNQLWANEDGFSYYVYGTLFDLDNNSIYNAILRFK